MLKALRNKKTAKKIWITLAIIIVPAFVLWGSGSLMRNKEDYSYVGKIFGKKIPLQEFKDTLEAVRNELIMQFGDNLSEAKKNIDLEYEAWKRLILLHEAKRRKITVSDREVVELIESYPFFQRNGKFNQKLYSEILKYELHTQERIFEEQTRSTLMLSKLYKQVTGNISVNEAEIKEEYRKLNEEISVSYITAVPSDFAKDIKPAGNELKEYFAKNSLQFKQPHSFNMDYISTDNEEKIKEVAGRLNKRADFSKIAKSAGLDIKETGLFSRTDPIPGIGWSPEILSLISKLKIGQYTPVIPSDKNYYILRLKEIKEAYIPDFEKIKDKVGLALIKEESEKRAKTKIGEYLQKLKGISGTAASQADFDKIAKDYGLKSGSTARFKFGSYIEGIGASDILWTAADELKNADFSGIIGMPSGFYIIRLKERVSVDEGKFASEKEDFRLFLLMQKRQETFAKFLEDLKRKAQ